MREKEGEEREEEEEEIERGRQRGSPGGESRSRCKNIPYLTHSKWKC